METGNDGRFYDWHYDYNHNGRLEINELMNYQDVTFGDHSDYNVSGGGSNMRTIMLALGFFLGVPILTAICPFFGIILLIVLITL